MKTNLYIDPISRMLDPRFRELQPSKKDMGASLATVRRVNIEDRTIEALVSTANVDRYEEIVEPSAFKKWLPKFMENSVFVAGHVYTSPDGQPTVIGKWTSVKITREGLVGIAKFADTDLAEKYWSLYRDGFMKAFSVGWLTHGWEMRQVTMPDGEKRNLRVFTEVELLEISAVAIPANREALARAASYGLTPSGVEAKGVKLGRRIRARREERNETLEEVAAKLPIEASTLQNIESGNIIRPPDSVLRAIASALDLSFSELQRLANEDQGENAFDGGDVRSIVREEIANHLNTDPGGHLACLIQDVVEACQATRDPYDDVPPAPGNTEKNSGGGHPAVDYLTGS